MLRAEYSDAYECWSVYLTDDDLTDILHIAGVTGQELRHWAKVLTAAVTRMDDAAEQPDPDF
jgi:hypothetical protein